MKIAYLITRADVMGGAPIHVRNLAAALRQQGHEVTVLVGGEGPFTEDLARHKIPFVSINHLVRPISPLKDLRALGELLIALRRLKPDLLCPHTAKAGWLGRLAGAVLNIPVVFTAHGWSIGNRISHSQGRVFCCAERLAAIFTDRIINVCESERVLALSHAVAPPERHAVIHNGLPEIAPNLLSHHVGQQPPQIVMIARMEDPKDHLALIQALGGLRNRAWTLSLIGDGPRQRLIYQQANDLNLLNRISFLGARSDVEEQLSRAQIFVLCSRFEAFPLSILEAMRAGLPVIASNVGGISEAVTHGRTGFLVASSDPSSIRTALESLVTNPELRVRMGAAGRQRYEEQFTFDRMLAGTLDVYAQVLPTHSASRFLRPVNVVEPYPRLRTLHNSNRKTG